MSPYASLLYFGILLYPAVLAIGLGLLGRLSWRWVVAINAAMLLVQYAPRLQVATGDTVGGIAMVAGYGVFQYAVARLFLWHRERYASGVAFGAAIAGVLAPMLIVKLLPLSGAAAAVGFLGISYATFRALDVVICVRDRLIKQLPPHRYLTFLLFFPTISAGPIDRYNRFQQDLDRRRTRGEVLGDLDSAVQHLFRGLLYKFILATLIKQYWLDRVAEGWAPLTLLSYMYAYAFYLFFDFAGYSAFAIGAGRIFGIRTPENFATPFLATNIADFWNRWHISLSFWFRDHVYRRVLMFGLKRKWTTNRLLISCFAFYLNFVLMAMWHGLAVRYLVYGLYHATLLSAYTVLIERRKRRPVARPVWWTPLSIVITFHLVCVGLLIFSGRLG